MLEHFILLQNIRNKKKMQDLFPQVTFKYNKQKELLKTSLF